VKPRLAGAERRRMRRRRKRMRRRRRPPPPQTYVKRCYGTAPSGWVTRWSRELAAVT